MRMLRVGGCSLALVLALFSFTSAQTTEDDDPNDRFLHLLLLTLFLSVLCFFAIALSERLLMFLTIFCLAGARLL